jgi:hypothetical protein
MRRVTAAIGTASVVVAVAGITTVGVAATTVHHYTACANSHHVLSLLVHGKCAHGASKVTIDSPGPRGPRGLRGLRGFVGPAGPGSVTTTLTMPASFNTNVGPAAATGISGVTVVPVCSSFAGVIVEGGDAASTARGEASVLEAASGDATVGFDSAADYQDLAAGSNTINLTGTLSAGENFAVKVTPSTVAEAAVDGQLVVIIGTASFTLQVALDYTTTTCSATAVVTRSTMAS